MRHLYTLVCDDVRLEVGNKLSLMGIYYEEIRFSSIPARLPKLCIFQRWIEVPLLKRVVVELSGSCLDVSIRAVGEPSEDPGQKTAAQLFLPFYSVLIVREGTLGFSTYFNDEPEVRHRHEINVVRPSEGKVGTTSKALDS
jgi:hypothetical protein